MVLYSLHIEVALHVQLTGSLVSLPFIRLSRSKSQSELEWQNEDNKIEIHSSPVNHRMRADWSLDVWAYDTQQISYTQFESNEWSHCVQTIFGKYRGYLHYCEKWTNNRKQRSRIFLKENYALEREFRCIHMSYFR